MILMDTLPPALRRRNPRTQDAFRREVFWQIGLPLGLALAALAGTMALVALNAAAPVGTGALADVSLIFLIVLAAGGGLVALGLLAGMIYGAAYLLRESPFWFKRAQDFVWDVAGLARSMTRQVDDRVVGVHVSWAALSSFGRHVQALFAPRRSA